MSGTNNFVRTVILLCQTCLKTPPHERNNGHKKMASCFNHVSLKGDQHEFSPNYIKTSSKEKDRRINKMMNKGEMLWSFIKFSRLIIDTGVENLYLDIGAWRVRHGSRSQSFKASEVLLTQTSHSPNFFFFFFFFFFAIIGHVINFL